MLGGYGFGDCNTEDVSILEFATAKNLLVGNTWFIKRESQLITYCSGDKRTQVDYVLYRKSFRRAVTNVKVIHGEECAPEHSLLTCDAPVGRGPSIRGVAKNGTHLLPGSVNSKRLQKPRLSPIELGHINVSPFFLISRRVISLL